MPTLYADTNDGYIQGHSTEWGKSRSLGTGTAASSNDDDSPYIVGTQQFTGRGADTWRITRSFYRFDTSGISVTPSSATLKIHGKSLENSIVIVVKSSQNSPLSTADFDAFQADVLTALDDSDGSNGGTLAGISNFTYSSQFSSGGVNLWDKDAYNDITLNAYARVNMGSFTVFRLCLMDYTHDFLDHAVTFGDGQVWSGGVFADHSDSSLRPYVDYTAGVAVEADNATFFGANF